MIQDPPLAAWIFEIRSITCNYIAIMKTLNLVAFAIAAYVVAIILVYLVHWLGI
jgi:hypothetical protein